MTPPKKKKPSGNPATKNTPKDGKTSGSDGKSKKNGKPDPEAERKARAAKKTRDAVRDREIIKTLPVALTDAEKLSFGSRLSHALARITELENDHDQVKKDHKQAVGAVQAEVVALGKIVRTGQEKRPVPCLETFNFPASTIDVHRLDTKEKVENRTMTVQERQLEMELKDLGPRLAAKDREATKEKTAAKKRLDKAAAGKADDTADKPPPPPAAAAA